MHMRYDIPRPFVLAIVTQSSIMEPVRSSVGTTSPFRRVPQPLEQPESEWLIEDDQGKPSSISVMLFVEGLRCEEG